MITNHQIQRAANARSRHRARPRSIDYWRGFKDGYETGRVKGDCSLQAEITRLRAALADPEIERLRATIAVLKGRP